MKTIFSRYSILVLVVLLVACNAENLAEYQQEEIVDITETETNAQTPDQPNPRKMVKSGALSFETDSINQTRKKLQALVNAHKGYVAKEQQSQYPGELRCYVSIKVPNLQFEPLIEAIQNEAKFFNDRRINTNDVTETFIDTKARLEAQKALESRFVSLLSKTNNISEILRIEKEIAQRRSAIESIEGKLNVLSHKVTYSTLEVSFYQRLAFKVEKENRFARALKNGWNGLVGFLVIMTNLWPMFVLGVVVYFIIRSRIKTTLGK
ncbi:MAG: DUF4349 domain-containing protein [Bacteroidota bacterium]